MIQVSKHAKERIIERIGCSERKMGRLVEKAWNSSEPIDRGDLNNKKWHEENGLVGEEFSYRKLMGMIYVFVKDADGGIKLVTVSKPSGRIGDKRKFVPTNEGKKFRQQMDDKV